MTQEEKYYSHFIVLITFNFILVRLKFGSYPATLLVIGVHEQRPDAAFIPQSLYILGINKHV